MNFTNDTLDGKMWFALGDVIRECVYCQRRKYGFCSKHERIGSLITNQENGK